MKETFGWITFVVGLISFLIGLVISFLNMAINAWDAELIIYIIFSAAVALTSIGIMILYLCDKYSN